MSPISGERSAEVVDAGELVEDDPGQAPED
jgi:hypothetical protein